MLITYNVRGNYVTFLKSLLFLPVSRCQKHPDAGEAVSIERVKFIWEEGGIVRRIHLKNQSNRMEGSSDDWEWMGPPARACRSGLVAHCQTHELEEHEQR